MENKENKLIEIEKQILPQKIKKKYRFKIIKKKNLLFKPPNLI